MKMLRGMAILAVSSAMTLACVACNGNTGANQGSHQIVMEQSQSQVFDTFYPLGKDYLYINKDSEPTREQKPTQKQKGKKKSKIKLKIRKLLWSVPINSDLQKYISQQCKVNDVPESLAYAVMDVETGGTYNPNKISATGDYGLFQINIVNQPMLSKKLGITDFLNPYQSVKAGTYMLGLLLHKYHDANEVAMAYNLGEGGASSALRHGIWSTEYSRKVIQAMYSLTRRTVYA